MKKAAIDIGTNSCRLLVSDWQGEVLLYKTKTLHMTRIGKDVDQTGLLREDRMEETIEALMDFAQVLKGMGIEKCPVFATSAVRDAKNRDDFLARVKNRTPFEIQVLTGDQEAELGFLGVIKGAQVSTDQVLVIDIGGGSTELIFGSQSGKINQAISLDMGAVRMTDRFQLTHPTPLNALEPIIQTLKDMLKTSFDFNPSGEIQVIGIGGTITTLGAMDLAMSTYDASQIQGMVLTHTVINEWVQKLAQMTLEEKLALPGLMPKRADVILAGAVILRTLCEVYQMDSVIVSDYDNLEGALYQEMLTGE